MKKQDKENTGEQYFEQPVEQQQKLRRMPRFLTFLIIIAILFVLYNQWQLYQRISATPKPEITTLPEIDIYKIVPANCKDCWNIDVAEKFIRENAQAKIVSSTSLNATSVEAKTLSKKYNLTRLPALIITGEIKKLSIPNFELRDNAFVFDKTPPPYVDFATGRVKGRVTSIVIQDSACKKCFDIKQITSQLKKVGVSFTSEKTLEDNTPEATALIEKYKIEKIPSLLMSNDALEYQVVSEIWAQVGTKEPDNMLILRTINPPFKEVDTAKIRGSTDVVYLVDKSCTSCYNASIHKMILTSNFGMVFDTEKYVDVFSKEGKLLISKYAIKVIPTVIISQDAKDYPNFATVWKQAGDTAKDGSFIFRNLNLLQGMTYKDLETGKTISATGQSPLGNATQQ